MSNRTVSGIGFIFLISAVFLTLLLASPLPAGCATPTEACPPGTGYGSGLRNPTQTASTIDEAEGIAQEYLTALDNPDLVMDKIIEFEKNFYVVFYERSTGRGAFVILISKPDAGPLPPMGPNGYYRPGEGPNSIWDTKYGLATPRISQSAYGSYDVNAATELALRYLDLNIPGTDVGEVHPFYGYFSFEILKDGKVYGIISVLPNTGVVLFQDWHGGYIQTRELR